MKKIFFLVLLLYGFSTLFANSLNEPRRIIGYFTEWRNGSNGYPTYLVDDIPWDKITHINYAFAQVNSTTNEIDFCDKNAAVEMIFPGQDESLPYKGHFNLLTKYKRTYTEVKTLISVGGWAASRGFYTMSDNHASREIFADSCIEFLRAYGFDGVDIDYEYPTSTSQAGNPDDFDIAEPRREQLLSNYVELMRLLREKLDAASVIDGKKYLLTIAAPASSWILGGMELGQYAQYLDYLNMMTYDFHGGWNGFVGHNSALMPDDRDPETAPLGTPVLNIDWGYKYFRGVLPPSKINVGIPYYSRGWKNVTQGTLPGGLYGSAAQQNGGAIGIDNIWHDLDENGNELPAGSNPLWHLKNLIDNRQNISYASDWNFDPLMTGTYERYYDTVSKVPYIWNNEKKVFLSMEDEESLTGKIQYIKDRGIGGMMIWELAGDFSKNADGEYYMGSTMTSLASDLFEDASPANDQMATINLPSEKMDFKVDFTGEYDHPNYTYALTLTNNTDETIPEGWKLTFSMPLTTTLQTPWGVTFNEIDGHDDFSRYEITGPAGISLAPGESYVIQGMSKLCFSGGPRFFILNGKSSIHENYQGTADTEAPSEPTGLAAQTTTDSSISIIWSKSTDNIAVTAYEIYLNGLLNSTTSSQAFTISGLLASTNYDIKVRAADGAGNLSDFSNEITIATKEEIVDTEAPSVPSNLSSNNITSNSFSLSWGNSTDNINVTGYRIYINSIMETTVNDLTATISDLIPNSTYICSISAIDEAGNESVKTAEITIKTLDENPLATGTPGSPQLTQSSWNGDTDYSIIMNMWWGNNGTRFELYENGNLIHSTILSDNSPAAQQLTVPFTGKENGLYKYTGKLINTFGTTESGILSYTVTKAAN